MTQRSTIIIDALDECDPDSHSELLIALSGLITKSEKVLNILVSSREDQDIKHRFSNSGNIHITMCDSSQDMRELIVFEVNNAIASGKLLGGGVSDEVRDLAINTLLQRADGMFRWVELQIQNLCNRRRIKRVEDLQAELKRSPQSLSETYDRVYEEIEQQASGSPSSSRAVTERALAWMVYGKRLLSTEELLAAISVDSWGIATAVSKDQLLEMCCNLITVDPELDTFRFSHFSVREYLGARQEYSTDFGNAIAAERCLIILTNPEFGFLPGVVKPNELMQDYAIRYWAPYCHSSGQRRDQGRLAELFSSFVQRENGTVPNFENWIRILESRKTELFRSYTQKNYNSPLARLSLWARTPAFRFRIDSYLSSQLRLYDLMSMISTPADPFFAACSWDFPEIVLNSVRFDRQILKKCNLWGETGLHLSCRNGHLGVARLLTEEGASVTTRAPGIGGQDSLGFASKGGHVEVVEFLLGHEDRVFLRTSWYNRALLQAAGEGHERIASLLLRRGANANGKYLDNRVGTPLSVAPSGGHAQIVRLLIKNGANVNKSSDQ